MNNICYTRHLISKSQQAFWAKLIRLEYYYNDGKEKSIFIGVVYKVFTEICLTPYHF